MQGFGSEDTAADGGVQRPGPKEQLSESTFLAFNRAIPRMSMLSCPAFPRIFLEGGCNIYHATCAVLNS